MWIMRNYSIDETRANEIRVLLKSRKGESLNPTKN
jgi:hypothetical protein